MTETPSKPEAQNQNPETKTKVTDMIRSFFKEAKTMTPKERMKAIGTIIFVAAIGRYLPKSMGNKGEKSGEAQTAEREFKAETEEGTELCMDPNLVGPVPEGAEPVCRKICKIEEVAKDHQHNVRLLEIAPNKQNELNSVVEKYKENKKRYETVAKATGIPAMLICAIHYREGFDFTRYLHNGEKLGKPTTYVPAGILFKENEWEKAAIHALGGDIADANGKPSLKAFQTIRQSLGLTADSKDTGAMMAFSEQYNGMGYRSRGIRSCYVYAGTNLNQPGRYVADHKFDPKSVDQRLGTAAVMMGIQSMESGQPLRIAGQKKDQTNKPA